jgi:hypothetical protein
VSMAAARNVIVPNRARTLEPLLLMSSTSALIVPLPSAIKVPRATNEPRELAPRKVNACAGFSSCSDPARYSSDQWCVLVTSLGTLENGVPRQIPVPI